MSYHTKLLKFVMSREDCRKVQKDLNKSIMIA